MGLRHDTARPEHDETIQDIAAILVQGYLRYRKGFRPFRKGAEGPANILSTAEKGVDSTGLESAHVTEGQGQ